MRPEPSALDELADALAIRAVLARRVEKQAAGPDWGGMANHLMAGDSPLYATLRNGLIGAGVGGIAGAAGLGSDGRKDRSALSDAARMAMLSGAIGGGGTAAYEYLPRVFGASPSASAEHQTNVHSMDVGPAGEHPLPAGSFSGDLANRMTAAHGAVNEGEYGNAAKQMMPVLNSENPGPHIGAMAGGAGVGALAGLGLHSLRRRAALPGQIQDFIQQGGLKDAPGTEEFAVRLLRARGSGVPGPLQRVVKSFGNPPPGEIPAAHFWRNPVPARGMFPGAVYGAEENGLLENVIRAAKKQNPMWMSRWGLGTAGAIGGGALGDYFYRSVPIPAWAK
jgi:hypothetical protein